MTPTDRDQQDREAFERWCNEPGAPYSRWHTWQAALAYERGKGGWQSMETAPKTTDVLCLLESGRCEVLYLTDNGEGFINTWRNLDGTASGYWPLHWQPLPSPPATQPQEQNDGK